MDRTEPTVALIELLLRRVPVAVAMFDLEMRYIANSERWLSDYRIEGQEIIGRSHYEVFPDIPDRWRDIYGRALKGETLSCDEDPFPRMNGSLDWVQWEIVPWRDAAGEIGGVVHFTHVITERVNAARAADAATAHLRSILATVPDAMFVIDHEGLILSFSAAAVKMFGYAEAAVLGKNVTQLIPAPYWEELNAYIESDDETDERRIIGMSRALSGLRKSGETFPLKLYVGKAETDGHAIFTCIIRDLTAQQRSDAEIEELRRQLVHVARVSAMGTMATTIAHELNQPIAAVVNFVQGVQTLLDDPDPLVSEALDHAASEALRAGDILRRLRTVVAHGEGKAAFESLATVVDDALALVGISARDKGVDILVSLDAGVDCVLIDRVPIAQVLINLVSNAIKALTNSATKQVTISSKPDNDHYVRVTVADTGKGIATSDAENLFRAFVSTKAEEMGLGLSICRTIVEAQDGRIWFEPVPGGGSMFHFTLPRGQTE